MSSVEISKWMWIQPRFDTNARRIELRNSLATFFLLIYLQKHKHTWRVWIALSSHVTQYNIHLIWSIYGLYTKRRIYLIFSFFYIHFIIFDWVCLRHARTFSIISFLFSSWLFAQLLAICPISHSLRPIFILNLSNHNTNNNRTNKPNENLPHKYLNKIQREMSSIISDFFFFFVFLWFLFRRRRSVRTRFTSFCELSFL